MKRSPLGKLNEIIIDLERCATQNEVDAQNPITNSHIDSCMARAVAGEQRRMLRILKELRKLL